MKKLLALALLVGSSSLFGATRFGFGVSFGVPAYYPPAPVYVASPPVYAAPAPVYVAPPVVVRPAYPGPGYVWVAPYWVGHRYVGGYWRFGAPARVFGGYGRGYAFGYRR